MNFTKLVSFLLFFLFISTACTKEVKKGEENMFEPLSYEQADQKADSVLALMTLEEKISYIGGDRYFFIRPIPRLGLKEVYMSDATQGIHIRGTFIDTDLSENQLEKSTAMPAPILLAATWNPELSYKYGESVGEECVAGNVGILLGPGMNIYRISQCGRNFEYFGEDPYLAASMIEKYVPGVQNTGTAATLKHFVANNTDFFRRKSNSVVDERTLHEIYLPAFKAGIDVGAKAVMTSYNQLNGEWCGQSEYVISDLLEKQLGFKWLVMTDWWSVFDGEKVVKSGQDIEMPDAEALLNVNELLEEGKITEQDIDGMVKSILRIYFAMEFDKKEADTTYLKTFDKHAQVALETAREGIVLLKNDDNILPVKDDVKTILATGDYMIRIWLGGGSAEVKGYDQKQMIDELKSQFGDKIIFEENPTVEQIKSADIVLCSIGTDDSEGYDRPFALPEAQEARVRKCVNNNPNTVVIVSSGSGIKMTDWNNEAKAVIYAWYPGQIGNRALAEIIAGKVNPSGKLPMTIEKDFKDSPGYGYMSEDDEFYTGWNGEGEEAHPIYDIEYDEGVLVGYRWYDTKNIEPLYHFGEGLSYTTFEYGNLSVSKEQFTDNEKLVINFTVKNTGDLDGKETAQLYIQDLESSVIRPVKELKGFKKIEVNAGEEKTVEIHLNKKAFSFWNPETKEWTAEKGKFIIHIGPSSKEIKLQQEIELI